MKNEKTLSGLTPEHFEKLIDGKTTKLCILTNSIGAELTVTNYGAKIVSLMVPDKNGKMTDVVTGHNSIDEYLVSEEPYFGAVCGRFGNRIAKGRFEIDGVVYDKLAINNGPNNLHGGIKGFNAVVWDIKEINKDTVTLAYTSADGEEGFPGNLSVEITYHLSDKNEVVIGYHATTDKPTVVNLTNHSYFNLSGAGDPSIGDHLLTINADYYLPTDNTAIPYGPKEAVEGTPMDFRTPFAVGSRIEADFEQLVFGNGYDHTYVLNKKEGEMAFCARCVSPKTGIVMETYTSEPGVQLYTGNWMTGNFVGKNGQRYPARAALCLETHHFPDSPNKPEYPTTTLRPGESFDSKTIYQFLIIQ
ncbi:aldose 1-epimerase [Parabacteroides sp. PF5-5]|uniref:aldose epimerase family protein n=1 Tax=unclassified Parabacteroides TaxID=2649774 RepID=UPI002476B86F|nr:MULTISPECIES: aldose epimerase family protein [unclassified Parabacteroides]MDH6306138.1 aldose 1-epimerase [Parabacteroides sp. PH5-39]MDH6317097.1 aldose 1-epimerase [Parabacteroides sp. PF5-13]MDH6320850.1 aldose 1-epimerase [Parabacteroides sp. PH5-13]MDH6324581.1 aldose 1-epimerase [Parabacteroides sp. PH5-8]MDH6328368.1 aldose 1-epimerase [Parabacteroides sp. PH5-41]